MLMRQLFTSQRYNDSKQQQRWLAHNKTETGDLKSCPSPYQSDFGPNKHQVRNPPRAAKSWNQPIFHAVVCENTSCCGLSWTWALTQSTSLCITGAWGFVCIAKDVEVEREVRLLENACVLVPRGLLVPLKRCLVCKVKTKEQYWLNYYSSTLLAPCSKDTVITMHLSWPRDDSSFNSSFSRNKVGGSAVSPCLFNISFAINEAYLQFSPVILWCE